MTGDEVVRPYGVGIIARLELLAGIALVCFGAGVIALADIIPKGDISISTLSPSQIVLYGSAGVALGVLAIVLAVAVWSMTTLGRRAALVCCVVGLFIPIFVAGLLGQVTYVFNLIVYPIIIYYLAREDVGKAFG